jgi:NDP-sugar pyrophosphorylase family protein
MQAVIFAAGRGTRMKELTDTLPKSMLPILGKPILEHKITALPKEVDEVILVVSYLGSSILNYFGGEFDGRRILYVEQENPVGGTADALWQAKDILKGKFVAMNGDDLYAREDIEECIRVPEWAMLVEERDPLGAGGKVIVDSSERVETIEEGVHEGKGLVNAGVYVLDDRIFRYEPVPKGPGETELGLPQTIMLAIGDIPMKAVRSTLWIQITSPEDLKKAEEILRTEA